MHVRSIRALREDKPGGGGADSGGAGAPKSSRRPSGAGSSSARSFGAGAGSGAGAGAERGSTNSGGSSSSRSVASTRSTGKKSRRPTSANPTLRRPANRGAAVPRRQTRLSVDSRADASALLPPASPERRWTAVELEDALKDLVFSKKAVATAAETSAKSVQSLQAFLKQTEDELANYHVRKVGLHHGLQVIVSLEQQVNAAIAADKKAEDYMESQNTIIKELRSGSGGGPEADDAEQQVAQLKAENAKLRAAMADMKKQRNSEHDQLLEVFKQLSMRTLELENTAQRQMSSLAERVTRLNRFALNCKDAMKVTAASTKSKARGKAAKRVESQMERLKEELGRKDAMIEQRDRMIERLKAVQHEKVMLLQKRLLSIARELQSIRDME